MLVKTTSNEKKKKTSLKKKTCLKAHLTVEPFALAGALGGTSESPFEQNEEPKRFHWKDLTFAVL